MSQPPPHKLRIQRQGSPGAWLVKLSGVIDESFHGRILDGLQGVVIFDFDEVTRVTSFGVREWILAQENLHAEYYAFVRCRPPVVTELNMIEGFVGRGEVLSCYAPFLCDTCEGEIQVLMDLSSQYQQIVAMEMPEVICPRDGSKAELDEFPDQYFAFVCSRPRPSPPRLAQQLMRGELEHPETRLSMRKMVQGEVTVIKLSGPLDAEARFKRRLSGLDGYVILDVGSVTSSTAEGWRKLVSTAREEGAPLFHVVRLHKDDISLFRQECGGHCLASIQDQVGCPSCGVSVAIDFDINSLPPLDSIAIRHTRCEHCRTEIQYSMKPADCALAMAALTVAPQPVYSYLYAQEAQEFDEQGSDSLSTSLTTNRYERIRKIGSGGMAEIFLAHQHGPEGFRKPVVIKQISPNETRRRHEFVEMLLQEARIVARLSHPNIVQVFDLVREGDNYILVMEYVDGWDLRMLLSRCPQRRVPVEICCRIIADLCAALDAAHATTAEDGTALGIIHRDISPSNILIARDGIVKITDFGIAKINDSLIQTQPGTIKGKVSYLAPEQIVGMEESIGPHTDIFSVGVVLFECLVGRRLFRASSSYGIMKAILHEPIPDVSALSPEIPGSLGQIVQRCLARQTSKRYQRTSEVAESLEQVLRERSATVTARDVARWLESLSISDDHSAIEHADSSDHQVERTARQDPTTRTVASPLLPEDVRSDS